MSGITTIQLLNRQKNAQNRRDSPWFTRCHHLMFDGVMAGGALWWQQEDHRLAHGHRWCSVDVEHGRTPIDEKREKVRSLERAIERERGHEREGERLGEEEKRLSLAWEGHYQSFRLKTQRNTSKNGGLAWRQREETSFPSLCTLLAKMANHPLFYFILYIYIYIYIKRVIFPFCPIFKEKNPNLPFQIMRFYILPSLKEFRPRISKCDILTPTKSIGRLPSLKSLHAYQY